MRPKVNIFYTPEYVQKINDIIFIKLCYINLCKARSHSFSSNSNCSLIIEN